VFTGLSSESVFHRHIALPDQKRIQTCPKAPNHVGDEERHNAGEKKLEAQIGSGDIARAARTQNEAIRLEDGRTLNL
jgi:hypothetical protein